MKIVLKCCKLQPEINSGRYKTTKLWYGKSPVGWALPTINAIVDNYTMPNYRRAREGGTFFFTVVTYNRQPILCLKESISALGEVIQETRSARPFSIDAWVLMPDHIHCIWTLPEGDIDFSRRWGLIKAGYTKRVGKALVGKGQAVSGSRLRHREGVVWQRRFWEHRIRDEKDYEMHCDYVHYNPVRHGFVKAPRDWAYSSFNRYVERGLYPRDWGSTERVEFPAGIGSE